MTRMVRIKFASTVFCTDLFPSNKSIFSENFHISESSINDNLPAKVDNTFNYFEIRHELLRMINKNIRTNTECSTRAFFQIEHIESKV